MTTGIITPHVICADGDTVETAQALLSELQFLDPEIAEECEATLADLDSADGFEFGEFISEIVEYINSALPLWAGLDVRDGFYQIGVVCGE
jgi:hypothetical protein